jgi:molybdenum cofactor cytidylyltransferase
MMGTYHIGGPAFAAVILAAGESTRMGQDKALLPWRGSNFLRAAIDALEPHADFVLVVAGKNAKELEPVVWATTASLIVNPNPARGQFSSLQTGLREVLNRGRDGAIITLVDRPPVRPETILQLRAAYLEAAAAGKWAVVPEHNGAHGHPIIAGRDMIEAFLRAPATSTARDVEHEHAERIQYVPVDDPLVTANVDTPEDYERVKAG